jgi:hypothetical protein
MVKWHVSDRRTALASPCLLMQLTYSETNQPTKSVSFISTLSLKINNSLFLSLKKTKAFRQTCGSGFKNLEPCFRKIQDSFTVFYIYSHAAEVVVV